LWHIYIMTRKTTLSRVGREAVSAMVGLYYKWQSARKDFFDAVRNLVYRIENNIPPHQPVPKQEIDKKGEYTDQVLFKKLEKIKEKANEHDQKYIERLIKVGTHLKKLESETRNICLDFVEKTDIWEHFLKDIKGIGPILAAGIIRYFDPTKTKHASSFWKFAGLHVENGKSPRREKGTKTGFNPRARTLCWVIADTFIKTKSPYSEIYRKEVERQLKKEYPKGYLHKLYPKIYKESDTKLKEPHARARARRYMVKMFLKDLWIKWRELLGLPVDEPYSARFHRE